MDRYEAAAAAVAVIGLLFEVAIVATVIFILLRAVTT